MALLRTLNRGLYEHRGRIDSEDGIVEHDAGNDDHAKPHHHPRIESYYSDPTRRAAHEPQPGGAIAEDERTVSTDQRRNRRDPAEPGITLKENSYGRPRRDRYKPRLAKVGTLPPPDRIHRLRNLSELGMVRIQGSPSMLLPGYVPGDMGQPAAADPDGMRRVGNQTVAGGAVEGVDLAPTSISRALHTMREREATCRTTLAQSATTLERNRAATFNIESAQLGLRRLRTVLERETLRACDPQKNISRQKSVIAAKIRQAPAPVSDKRLKAETSPVHVIEAATRYYRINPEDYTTGVGRDGTPRIFHGGKQYNLGDFFTKHLGKTWDEVKPILTECYQASLSDALPQPDLAMWVAFNEWRSQSFTHRQNERENAREQLRDETLAVRALYKAQKEAAQKLKGAERRGAMAEARAARVIAMEEIAQSRQNVYETLKSPGRNAEYRTFLNNLAAHGDLAALAELRRVQRAQPETGGPDFIHGQQADSPVFALPNYRVDIAGNVIYQDQGKAIIKDAKRGVEVLNTEQRTYDLALKVAVSRYGKSLTLNGDETFKQQMVEAARRSRLDLVFKDGRNPLAVPVRVNGPSRGR